jgi:hypothetical protein
MMHLQLLTDSDIECMRMRTSTFMLQRYSFKRHVPPSSASILPSRASVVRKRDSSAADFSSA